MYPHSIPHIIPIFLYGTSVKKKKYFDLSYSAVSSKNKVLSINDSIFYDSLSTLKTSIYNLNNYLM